MLSLVMYWDILYAAHSHMQESKLSPAVKRINILRVMRISRISGRALLSAARGHQRAARDIQGAARGLQRAVRLVERAAGGLLLQRTEVGDRLLRTGVHPLLEVKQVEKSTF